MANESLIQDVDGSSLTQIRFFITASFSPVDAATNWTIGTPTDVAITLAGVLDGEGRQSIFVDLGAVRALEYDCFGCVDFTALSPTAGEVIEYHWLPKTSSTEANGNVFGNSGQDGDAPHGAIGSVTLAEFKLMAQPIGVLRVTDDGTVQTGYVGRFSPASRWGQLLIINESGATFMNDDVEMHQVLNPVVPELQ